MKPGIGGQRTGGSLFNLESTTDAGLLYQTSEDTVTLTVISSGSLRENPRDDREEILGMEYPSILEVEEANREQLAKWVRFLPSPGLSAVGSESFWTVKASQDETLHLILKRFHDLGGWTPELSKRVGHGRT